MKHYFSLTKFGIGVFVVVSGLAGYAASLPYGVRPELTDILVLMFGLYAVSAGSFALNQVQEWREDKAMPRTANRPIPLGKISIGQAYIIGVVLCLFGIALLYLLSPLSAQLSMLTIILYNGLYTMLWKRRWAFGAVPGALPGAMPVVIGYAANTAEIFTPECIYLFLIMFLWQMPHFWAIAVRYKDDYQAGGFPVLPTQLGKERTLYHIGLYTFAFIGVALAAPFFISTQILYAILILPLAAKVIWEFFKFYNSENPKAWLPFFLWSNLSMLVFICAPVFEKYLTSL